MRAAALAALLFLLAGCACQSTWFRRCSPMPAGTTEECARAATGDHEAALAACQACMQAGDSAAACSRRMWGK